MTQTKNAVIIGAGARGNRVFADLISRHDTGFRTAGVVELDPARRRAFQERYGIAPDRAFASVEDFLAAPRFGDIVFICTPDPTHYSLCRAVSEKGYDILLEKPIATSLPDCLAMLEVESSSGNRIFVAHVLRYAPFFRTVKRIVAEGSLGRIRNVRLSENVGHWHFAHSYVRGSWRRADLSAPVILTKSSHDLDILVWLVGDRVRNVTSTGALTYFTPANAPAGAAARCVECPYEDSCLYSATRFYLNEREEWPFNVIAPPPDTLEQRREAIAGGPYGSCVWHNDNDVCDTQTVLMEFASGIHATFELQALTADNTRQLRILFDSAELVGDLHRGTLEISHFTGRKDELRTEPVPIPEAADSHGGGDLQLLLSLHEHLTQGTQGEVMTSLRSSLPSHAIAFIAEESRRRRRRLAVPDIFGDEARKPARLPRPPRGKRGFPIGSTGEPTTAAASE
ncbi:MAG TPA: Gfo/Idh/MocA family oxidoreductase [Longimicrobiaceae bacterium]